MFSFKQFLIEVRSKVQALTHLNDHADRNFVSPEEGGQILNLIPHAESRPNIGLSHFEFHNEKLDDPHYKPVLKDVPVGSLVSGQHTVSHEVVGKKIRGLWKGHDPEIPYVIHDPVTNSHIMVDGNHRGCQAIAEGQTHIKALVVHAKTNEPRTSYRPRPEPESYASDDHDYESSGHHHNFMVRS